MRLAWAIYEHMLPLRLMAADSPIPAHQKGRIYNALLKAFAILGDGWRAKELAEHMEAAGFLPTEEAMSNMVVAMAKSRLRHEAQE
jgi:pentatricopeptide repeat protein